MRAFSHLFHHYWLPVFLLLVAGFAAFFVYKAWDRITVKGSGRK